MAKNNALSTKKGLFLALNTYLSIIYLGPTPKSITPIHIIAKAIVYQKVTKRFLMSAASFITLLNSSIDAFLR